MKIETKIYYRWENDDGVTQLCSAREMLDDAIPTEGKDMVHWITIDGAFFAEFDYQDDVDMIAAYLRTRGGKRKLELIKATNILAEQN
jgi:hypothetical protein